MFDGKSHGPPRPMNRKGGGGAPPLQEPLSPGFSAGLRHGGQLLLHRPPAPMDGFRDGPPPPIFAGVLPPHLPPHPHPAAVAAFLEDRLAAQHDEIQGLLFDNQRVAATHVALKQELAAVQQDLHLSSRALSAARAEKELQLREAHDKTMGMETEFRALEAMRSELIHVMGDIQRLNASRQELTVQAQALTQDLARASAADWHNNVHSLKSEIEAMKKEVQRARNAIEYEKKGYAENYEQGLVMEKNLISMAREVEKLRAEVANAEKSTVHATASVSATQETAHCGSSMNPDTGHHGAAPYPTTGYGNPDPGHHGAVPPHPTTGYGNPDPGHHGAAPPHPTTGYGNPDAGHHGAAPSYPTTGYGNPDPGHHGAAPPHPTTGYGNPDPGHHGAARPHPTTGYGNPDAGHHSAAPPHPTTGYGNPDPGHHGAAPYPTTGYGNPDPGHHGAARPHPTTGYGNPDPGHHGAAPYPATSYGNAGHHDAAPPHPTAGFGMNPAAATAAGGAEAQYGSGSFHGSSWGGYEAQRAHGSHNR